jgi:hypothetical protein
VPAGQEKDRLVGAIAALRAELDPGGLGRAPGGPGERPRARLENSLGAEEEDLIATIVGALAGLAAAAAAVHPRSVPPPPSATIGALGGAEWVMRATFVDGRAMRIGEVVPDFVYLVTLPFVGEAEALRLWRRAQELVAGIGEDTDAEV